MKGHPWTETELETLKRLYSDTQCSEIAKILNCTLHRIYNKAFPLGLKKSDTFLESIQSGRLNKLTASGVAYRFPKGHKPFNKGKKQKDYISEQGRLNILKTTFKPGHLPHNTKSDKEITLRNDEGRQYKYIRIALGKWIPLHVYQWEKVNGPVPSGMLVVFKNKDAMNCDISNLELITREENMARNTIHRYPQELKFAIKKLHQLKRQIHGKEQNSGLERSFI